MLGVLTLLLFLVSMHFISMCFAKFLNYLYRHFELKKLCGVGWAEWELEDRYLSAKVDQSTALRFP